MKGFGKLNPILLPLIVLAGIIGYVAYRTRRVPTPRRRWKRFEVPGAVPLNASDCATLQGLYTIAEGYSFFGKTAVVKYSYTVEETGTVYHLSFFCEKNGTYILAEGRKQGKAILLQGHWRKAAGNGAGVVRLVIEDAEAKPIAIHGMFGNGDEKPARLFSLSYQQPLPTMRPFDIIAHRGGARNVDFLPDSENSLEMIKMATRLGATGVEIDVRMTKDGVPVIFHDSFFSIHTIQDKIYGGLLHNHTLAEIKQYTLRKGGKIPTLEEMLSAIVYQTGLEVVWLDMKKECDLAAVRKLQKEFLEKAAAINRRLVIYIGIPDKYMLGCFTALDNYRNIPSLIELDWSKGISINAEVWAPQYTGGFQGQDVKKVHAAGKKAYVWSLDSRFMIQTYIDKGGFDGLVTNVPSVVAHWFYTHTVQAEASKAVQ